MTTSRLILRNGDEVVHHGSHSDLLYDLPAELAPNSRVDAVIVPTSRPVDRLREAMALAEKLDCLLVALCSGSAEASHAAESAEPFEVKLIAIDVPHEPRCLPVFRTTKVLAGTAFETEADTSVKRNLALLLARAIGWTKVLYLDDDISDLVADDIRAACGFLGQYNAVGIYNAGFPDNSVVCHAFREVGPFGAQGQFIGTGALAVNPMETTSFFPKIYNEDWLFLLGDAPIRLAVTGKMSQKTYAPFADTRRATQQELGDVLGEGLYWLLDEQLELERADASHWRDFLRRRRRFIEYVLEHVHQGYSDESIQRVRRIAALEAALQRNALINPSLCLEFVESWRTDLEMWRLFTSDFGRDDSLEDALKRLGLAEFSYCT